MSDDDIAALLHVHREHVEHRREQALERMAEDLDAGSGAEVAVLVGQSMRANGEALLAAEPQPTGDRRRGRRRMTDFPPPPEEAAGPSYRRGYVLAAAALVAGAATLAVALFSGGEEPVLGPEPGTPVPAPAPRGNGPSVAFAPLTPGGAARGSAQLRGSSLRLGVSGLPAGSYAVWLFDDVSNARLLARFDGPAAKLDAKLPDGFRRYRSIDISREPADGNPNHSGASVLRAPLAKLLGR